MAVLALVACGPASTEPAYIVQVSLGSWDSPDYTAGEIIDRIDSVSSLINVKKVILGWSLDKDIYHRVGSFLHGKGIEMLLWLPVFAETDEVCDNEPAVDLWGEIPANYDLAAGEGFRFNCPSDPRNAANIIATVCPAAIATPLYRLDPKLMRLGVRIGLIRTPEWLVRRALKAMFRGRRMLAPAFMNVWLPALVAALPGPVVRKLWKRFK